VELLCCRRRLAGVRCAQSGIHTEETVVARGSLHPYTPIRASHSWSKPLFGVDGAVRNHPRSSLWSFTCQHSPPLALTESSSSSRRRRRRRRRRRSNWRTCWISGVGSFNTVPAARVHLMETADDHDHQRLEQQPLGVEGRSPSRTAFGRRWRGDAVDEADELDKEGASFEFMGKPLRALAFGQSHPRRLLATGHNP
jgi:hypothetical protein